MIHNLRQVIGFTAIAALSLNTASAQSNPDNCSVSDIVWQGLGMDENQSMPFGNGDMRRWHDDAAKYVDAMRRKTYSVDAGLA